MVDDSKGCVQLGTENAEQESVKHTTLEGDASRGLCPRILTTKWGASVRCMRHLGHVEVHAGSVQTPDGHRWAYWRDPPDSEIFSTYGPDQDPVGESLDGLCGAPRLEEPEVRCNLIAGHPGRHARQMRDGWSTWERAPVSEPVRDEVPRRRGGMPATVGEVLLEDLRRKAEATELADEVKKLRADVDALKLGRIVERYPTPDGGEIAVREFPRSDEPAEVPDVPCYALHEIRDLRALEVEVRGFVRYCDLPTTKWHDVPDALRVLLRMLELRRARRAEELCGGARVVTGEEAASVPKGRR